LKKESLSPTNLQRKLPQTKNQEKEQKQKKQKTQKKVRAKGGGGKKVGFEFGPGLAGSLNFQRTTGSDSLNISE
jgi:hypothetical protein